MATTALAKKVDTTAIELVVKECGLATLANQGKFERVFTLAQGIQRLRELITPEMMKSILALQNTSLGFRTDKQGGYDEATVKECLIEATLRGVNPVGNQFNIIAGRCYITKEGFTQTLMDLPGFTDLELTPGVPLNKSGGAVVPYGARWKYQGVPMELEREIPVRVNQGMGADAILGKAERKMRKAVFERCVGSAISLPDGDVGDGENGVVPADGKNQFGFQRKQVANEAQSPAAETSEQEQGEPEQPNASDASTTVGKTLHALLEGKGIADAEARSATIAKWAAANSIDVEDLALEVDGNEVAGGIIDKANKVRSWAVYKA